MKALRCTTCGDVRWSLVGLQRPMASTCGVCGGERAPERRLPGRRGGALPATGERRDLAALSAASGKVPRAGLPA